MREGKVTDPVEWKPFGFEFKPGKLVFGEYIAQGRFLFVRDGVHEEPRTAAGAGGCAQVPGRTFES
jgi:hypothetical protein